MFISLYRSVLTSLMRYFQAQISTYVSKIYNTTSDSFFASIFGIHFFQSSCIILYIFMFFVQSTSKKTLKGKKKSYEMQVFVKRTVNEQKKPHICEVSDQLCFFFVQSVCSSFRVSGTTDRTTACTGATVKAPRRRACPSCTATVECITTTSSQPSK